VPADAVQLVMLQDILRIIKQLSKPTVDELEAASVPRYESDGIAID
jgi:hypothetical protein